MANSGYKSISRIEQGPSGQGNDRRGRTAGWYARVWWQGETYGKYFGDATYGGRQEALAEAVAWRNAKEREMGKPRTELPVAVYLAGEAGAEELRLMRERAELFAQKVNSLKDEGDIAMDQEYVESRARQMLKNLTDKLAATCRAARIEALNAICPNCQGELLDDLIDAAYEGFEMPSSVVIACPHCDAEMEFTLEWSIELANAELIT